MHPYNSFGQTAFWKSGVASGHWSEIDDVWSPKFGIDEKSVIITAGSCFAQHISKALIKNGYNWLDAEAPEKELTEQDKRIHHCGEFSFRTGNIYTVALLKQWIEWSFGKAEIPNEYFREGEKWFDPFRPHIPETGYYSREEVDRDRVKTLTAIRHAFQNADLFIFTLGLTEAWKNINGWVYPICPGTIRGEYKEDTHKFINFTFGEIYSDMISIVETLRSINKSMNIIFTVSPVPLTATASGKHVLVATSHSKSILRSVSGQISEEYDDIDYFPSYELITSSPFRSIFFDNNLRTVSNFGVNFVMGHFFSAIDRFRQKDTQPRTFTLAEGTDSPTTSGEDVVCEDAILETWSRKTGFDQTAKAVLIGDSHIGYVGDAMTRRGLRYFGGGIMAGSRWAAKMFHLEENTLFSPTDDAGALLWSRSINDINSMGSTFSSLNFVTNIGNHTHVMLMQFMKFMMERNGNQRNIVYTEKDVADFIINTRSEHIALLRMFRSRAKNVYWITDPPRPTNHDDLRRQFEREMINHATSIGISVIDCRAHFLKNGAFPAELECEDRSDDVHGNEIYYSKIVEILKGLNAI